MADSRNHKKVGEWKQWDDLVPDLDAGDLLEIQRGKIQHWGVFVEAIEGKGIIVHVNGDVVTGLGKIVGKRTLADIRVEDGGTIVAGDEVRVNNGIDETLEPFAAGAQVVKRGLSKLGQHDYDPFNNNCEHWANWCRNGVTVSMQADEAKAKAEEIKNKPKTTLGQLKDKLDDTVEKIKGHGPPKPPKKVDIPAEALDKLPFLKKFQNASVDEAEAEK